MKKYLHIYIIIAAVVASLSACHKISVTSNSLYTGDVFPTNDEQYQSVIGNIYTSLRGHYPLTYWFVQECSSDEAILPTYGGNWYDGGKYIELHRHTWTKDNAWIQSEWSDVSSLIGLCNQTIYIFRNAPEGVSKNTALAEIKTLRAWAYWEMVDMFGGVPLDTIYPSPGIQAKASRTEVFSYIESELKAAIPSLKATVGSGTYGKVTKWMAFTLLAKLYLNAEVYTGTKRYNDCIAACDSVINSGGYSIAGRSAYLNMFYPTNKSGSSSTPEFIFTIPYDPSTSNGFLYHARYDLNRNLGIKYKYAGASAGSYSYDQILLAGSGADLKLVTSGNGFNNVKPSGPRATLSSFYNGNFTDANDIRNDQWLVGYQNWPDGNPIEICATKSGYNQFYTASDKTDTIHYNLYIDSIITLRQDVATMDCGNDETAWNMGIRNIKFYPDGSSSSRNQGNDAPLFRYSDVLLMKAEAILRGGTATNGQTALSLVNTVRSNRTTSAALTSITLDNLYAERCREFTWECWHRNDMIRFGKFENAYGFKTNSDTYRRIFPIPTNALATNGKLIQNTGY